VSSEADVPPRSPGVPARPASHRTPPAAARAALTRFLPQVQRQRRRLADPETGVPLQSLLVADLDLDLDLGTVTVHEPVTPPERAPEGVHALVWFHGRPLGEVTVLGDPDDVVAQLPAHARRQLVFALYEHLLHDALSTPNGVQLARTSGLSAVDHPAVADDGATAPTITIAICTRDRPDALRRCLTAVARLADPVLEVLVIDNASCDDRTRRVVVEFPFARCIPEPRRGLDWARNRALLEARGDVIAYTDDDVLVHPGWVGGLLRAFREEPTAVGVTGLVVAGELSTSAQVLFEALGGFSRGFRRLWFSAAVRNGEVAAATFGGTGGAGTGANMAFRRARLLELGGFDTALDVGTPTGGGGDLEMYFRLVAAGDLLVYEPSAVVRHLHRPDYAGLVKQMRGNGTGSYAQFLGAGRLYGPAQARAFVRLASWWGLHWHLRGIVRSVVAPDLVPMALRLAETRGAVDSVLLRYYRRAQQQAAAEDALHGGPHVGEPVRVPALAPERAARLAEPVVDVDVLAPEPPTAPDPPVGQDVRRVRVRVLREGVPQHAFSCWTRGSALSDVRLRWAVVDQLGPALLEPGLAFEGPQGYSLGGPPAEPALLGASSPPLSTQQVEVLDALLAGNLQLDRALPPSDVSSAAVLLCTRDRPEQLRAALRTLTMQQTRRTVTVVVVDNSDDPATTRRICADHAGIVVLHEPRPGLSRARNAALPVLDADAVVFVDDDVVAPSDWLERLLDGFLDPTIAMVTGNVLPANLDSLEAQVFEDYGALGRGPWRRVFEPEWLAQHRRAVPTWMVGATANAAVRTEWLRRLGPFIEHLGAGTPAGVGEDTEYFYRVLRAGGRILYEPTAVVHHYHRADRASLVRQLRGYSAGHVAYHLELAVRYGDLRGLGRVAISLPRHFARQATRMRRGTDDLPPDLYRAQVRGHVAGVGAWVRARRAPR
jgi:O-antigen biosynthesis protein